MENIISNETEVQQIETILLCCIQPLLDEVKYNNIFNAENTNRNY